MLIKIYMEMSFFAHACSSDGCIDSNQILHINSLCDIFETISKLLEGFGRGGGAKFDLSQ